MAEIGEHNSILDKISEKIHEYKGSSSSSDSEDEQPSSHAARTKRLFGRKEPLHKVLGGGRAADLVLWKNKQISSSILAGVTVIWIMFGWLGYHLLTFLCRSLITFLSVCFLWSNAASFVNRSPPKFPEVIIPEDLFLQIAQSVRYEVNEAFASFRYIASGKDLKTFFMTIAGLWIISVVGSWFSFLTLSYIIFVLAYTLPMLYEKYEDQVDAVGEKAMIEIRKQYAVLDEKVFQKIPRCPFAAKKQH